VDLRADCGKMSLVLDTLRENRFPAKEKVMIQSTALTRELGARLRECREQTTLMAFELAEALGWHPSKVSRMENGLRTPDPIDVAMYLGCCGIEPDICKEVLDLAQMPDQGFWLRPHHKQLPDRLLSLVMNETTAKTLFSFEPLLVPGLLQTQTYAAEVMRGVISTEPTDIRPQVQARMARQELLSRQAPPESAFFINESVLRYPVGGPEVMNEQLLQLVFATSRAHVNIRVIPMSAGMHAGMRGPFVLMHYHDRRPVVWLEGEAMSTLVEDPEIVDTYRKIRSELYRIALDEGQSRSWLADLASEYDLEERDRVGGPDCLA
jgi:transcriptional regulator with XRE-family HTH domain